MKKSNKINSFLNDNLIERKEIKFLFGIKLRRIYNNKS